MKFFVISDTHGKLDKVLEIYSNLHDIDMIIHLGDYEKDGKELAEKLGTDVITVRGNMDGGYTQSEFEILETEYDKLLLTHGHMQNVKTSLTNLMYFAEEKGCKAALFGHTHRPVFENVGGLYLINPGSLTLPADGTQGSYAIVNTSADGISGEIIYYKAEKKEPPKPAPSSNKPKVQGGFLREMLNYSDRF